MALPALERERRFHISAGEQTGTILTPDFSVVSGMRIELPPMTIEHTQLAIAPDRLALLSADFSHMPDYECWQSDEGIDRVLQQGSKATPGLEMLRLKDVPDIYGREYYIESSWLGGERIDALALAVDGNWQYKQVALKLSTTQPVTQIVHQRVSSPDIRPEEYKITHKTGEGTEAVINIDAKLGREGEYSMTIRARAMEAMAHGLLPMLNASQLETLEEILQQDPFAVIEERVRYAPKAEKREEQISKMLTITHMRRTGGGYIPESIVSRSQALYIRGQSEYTDDFISNTAPALSPDATAQHESYIARRSRMPAEASNRPEMLEVAIFTHSRELVTL